MNKKLSFFQKILLWLNIAAVGLLLLAYAAPYISPQKFWPLAFIGLGYVFIVLLNAFFILLWVLQGRMLFLISLFAIILGWNYFTRAFTYHFPSAEKPENSFKLMSYNVKNFDLYNWSQNLNSKNLMFQLIGAQNPDIICFQEFYTEESGSFHTVKQIRENLRLRNYYFEKNFTVKKVHHWGLAIFSKHPIINKGKIEFDNSIRNECIYADIKLKSGIIRVYNLHMQSVHFQQEDYKYIEQVKTTREHDLISSRKLLGKVKRAFIKRAEQAELVGEHIAKSPYPVIVCGDFNDTPVSYTYATISRGLEDGFQTMGRGMSRTFAGPLPLLNIDHLLFHDSLQIHEFEIIRENYSDHFPLVGVFSLKEKE